MRLLTLFFLPVCLWSQQIDVQWNWQGIEKIHVGDMLKRVPKAIGHTVFYEEEHKRFGISISKQLGDNPNIQYSVENVQTQEVQSDLEVDFDLDQFAARPHTVVYKTKGRDVHQVVVQIEPFIVKNNKLHAVSGFTIVPHAVKQLVAQRVQRIASISSMPPQSGYRFEVNQTGIHKITAAFLRDLGMPISTINPETLKIFGRGGKMLSLINSENEGVNYGFSENHLQLIGMDDGSIDDEDYILFYAYGSTEWNDDSQTAVNLYHDQAHYIISYGGENGLRVNLQQSAAIIDNLQTSASVSLHTEEDLVNIAQMGRKWLGDSFLHNSSKKYSFQLTNRKAKTAVDIKFAAAASATGGSYFDLNVENASMSLNLAATQTLKKASEGTISLSTTLASNDLDVQLLSLIHI